MMSDFGGRSVVQRQLFDANQLHKLGVTLGRPIDPFGTTSAGIPDQPPIQGTPVPAGWHLVYFTPDGLETELGRDGTDTSWNAPGPFTRRMWAGGTMTWSKSGTLRVGQEIEERTKLLSATPKKSRSAGEMVLVDVEKEFWSPEGLALTDRRSWVFRPELDPSAALATTPVAEEALKGVDMHARSRWEDVQVPSGDTLSRELRWSATSLFRFSALTFNGHKIHLDENWARQVEGHPGLVVHGPLTLIGMLDFWRATISGGKTPGKCTYRAMSPIYAGETHKIRQIGSRAEGSHTITDLEVDKNGVVCTKATIED